MKSKEVKEGKSKVKRVFTLLLLLCASSFLFGQNTTLESFGLKGNVKNVKEKTEIYDILFSNKENLKGEINTLKVFNLKGYVTSEKSLDNDSHIVEAKFIYDSTFFCMKKINYTKDGKLSSYYYYIKKEDKKIEYALFDKFDSILYTGNYTIDKYDRIIREENISNNKTKYCINNIYDEYSEITYSNYYCKPPKEADGNYMGYDIKYMSFDKNGNWNKCIKNYDRGRSKEIVTREIEYF